MENNDKTSSIPELSIFYNNDYYKYGECFLIARKEKNPYICNREMIYKVYSFDEKLDEYFDYWAESRGFNKIVKMFKNDYGNLEIKWFDNGSKILKTKLTVIRNNLRKYFTNNDLLDYGILDSLIDKIKK